MQRRGLRPPDRDLQLQIRARKAQRQREDLQARAWYWVVVGGTAARVYLHEYLEHAYDVVTSGLPAQGLKLHDQYAIMVSCHCQGDFKLTEPRPPEFKPRPPGLASAIEVAGSKDYGLFQFYAPPWSWW